jgi:hypothetical protein
MAYVYKHIRKDTNEVFYVGIGKNKKRKNSKHSRSNHWHSIIKKTEYYSEVIEDDLSWECACEREIFWIKFYGRKDLNEGKLVNKTNGGEGNFGLIFSEESKKKISESLKGKKLSEEHKQKLSEAGKGRKYSDESKKKMSDSAKGKQKTKEHKENLSKSGKGVKRTEEFKEKLRNLYKGKQRNKDMTWKK